MPCLSDNERSVTVSASNNYMRFREPSNLENSSFIVVPENAPSKVRGNERLEGE